MLCCYLGASGEVSLKKSSPSDRELAGGLLAAARDGPSPGSPLGFNSFSKEVTDQRAAPR